MCSFTKQNFYIPTLSLGTIPKHPWHCMEYQRRTTIRLCITARITILRFRATLLSSTKANSRQAKAEKENHFTIDWAKQALEIKPKRICFTHVRVSGLEEDGRAGVRWLCVVELGGSPRKDFKVRWCGGSNRAFVSKAWTAQGGEDHEMLFRTGCLPYVCLVS